MIGVAACSSDPAADDTSTDAGAKTDGPSSTDSGAKTDSSTGFDSGTGVDSSTPVDSGVDSSISCAAAGCSADATCSETSGTAVCTCKPGFTGNGKTCSDVNECAVNPCLNGGTCANGANAFTCTCAPGYSGTTCQTNVNECAVNPCLNGGTCVDGVNSYTCTCAPGYSGATCQTNIDECAANPCQNGGVCTDGVNSFTCACAFGYTGATCTSYFPSCYAMKTAQPAAPDGDYMIDRDGAGALAPITVTCDMTTDGGGYTSYLVVGGIATTRFDEANSCTALGMNMVIPRTHLHLDKLWALYGSKGYMQTVSGVYGLAAGSYTNCAMNSGDATCGANWVALDGGKWFARAIAYTEPNGDYTAGGWLGGYNTAYDANGMFFNDLTSSYSTGTTYVCSDNAKP